MTHLVCTPFLDSYVTTDICNGITTNVSVKFSNTVKNSIDVLNEFGERQIIQFRYEHETEILPTFEKLKVPTLLNHAFVKI